MPANSTFTELVSTTFRKHRKDIRDNISKNNALYARLSSKGNLSEVDGGTSIVQALDYAENSTYQRYSGYDTLNIQSSDVISAAEFAWRQIAIHVVASGLEMRINSGESAFLKLVANRMKNAIRTFKNNFSADLYSDGTATNQIGGLQLLVADAGTGVVGGIDSSTYTFWKNKVQSAAAPLQGGGAITPAANTIESLMLPLYLACSVGDDQPDLIVMDNNYYTFFDNSQTSLKRYVNSSNEKANAGFVTIAYKNADVIYDGGSGIPTNHAYFLNTDHIELVAHKEANMTVLDEIRPTNQDAAVVPVLWMGNLTVANRSRQGVMKA